MNLNQSRTRFLVLPIFLGIVSLFRMQAIGQEVPVLPPDAASIRATPPGQSVPLPSPSPAVVTPPQPVAVGLDELVGIGLELNPRLAQVRFEIDSARGRALQAGLYPNPTVSAVGDELGDRQGPGGIWTAPHASQEIVTAGKLRLNRAAANQEVDQATLTLMTERYQLLANIRRAYFEVLTLQAQIEVLRQLVQVAEKSVQQTTKLLDAKQVARLDLVQLEVEAERIKTELEATERQLPGAFRQLAATVGVSTLPISNVAGALDLTIPAYDLEQTQVYVLSVHPQLRSAQVGVERAQLLLRRAQVEPIPNVTVGTGYVRQNQNLSSDWTIGVSLPVPLWNRNQGNIAAAQAAVGEALQQVKRMENELTDRLATAYRNYAAAQRRAERYRTFILPRAQETYALSLQAYQGGQFEYLRVLEAQRAFVQAYVEYIRALGEAWQAASLISGLTLEDQWPPMRLSQSEGR